MIDLFNSEDEFNLNHYPSASILNRLSWPFQKCGKHYGIGTPSNHINAVLSRSPVLNSAVNFQVVMGRSASLQKAIEWIESLASISERPFPPLRT